jgi:hypothetical protein
MISIPDAEAVIQLLTTLLQEAYSAYFSLKQAIFASRPGSVDGCT